MRQRTELALGLGLVVVLGVAAALFGARRARQTDADPRRSTLLTGPSGARGFADALERLGVRVEPFERPVGTLHPDGAPETLTAFLGPTSSLSPGEGATVARLDSDLLLAGFRASTAMRCLGWSVRAGRVDSVRVVSPPGTTGVFPRVRAVLERRSAHEVVDSSEAEDAAPIRCTVPESRTVDTLLHTADGQAVALRTVLADGRTVTLVADDRLFANRALRETAAGPFALALVVPRYRRLVVDEYHHGFDASRSLAGAALGWTVQSPWGWIILQLAGVGVLALLAAGIRFGPVRPGIERRRRSPLEHVRALATALAAARGHDEAVTLIVQGLHRRLASASRPSRGEIAGWLEGLTPAVRTPEGREALHTLTSILRRPASSEEVLRAAEATDTLWKELTPT
ncbi:MAG: DUF4350 domain-containing protein [Gemmatimonadales bacterium]